MTSLNCHVRFTPRADIAGRRLDVRFVPLADMMLTARLPYLNGSCAAAKEDRYSITSSARASTDGGIVRPKDGVIGRRLVDS
jgi:hypothetical protein